MRWGGGCAWPRRTSIALPPPTAGGPMGRMDVRGSGWSGSSLRKPVRTYGWAMEGSA